MPIQNLRLSSRFFFKNEAFARAKMNFAGKIGDRALFLYYIIPGLVKY